MFKILYILITVPTYLAYSPRGKGQKRVESSVQQETECMEDTNDVVESGGQPTDRPTIYTCGEGPQGPYKTPGTTG